MYDKINSDSVIRIFTLYEHPVPGVYVTGTQTDPQTVLCIMVVIKAGSTNTAAMLGAVDAIDGHAPQFGKHVRVQRNAGRTALKANIYSRTCRPSSSTMLRIRVHLPRQDADCQAIHAEPDCVRFIFDCT